MICIYYGISAVIVCLEPGDDKSDNIKITDVHSKDLYSTNLFRQEQVKENGFGQSQWPLHVKYQKKYIAHECELSFRMKQRIKKNDAYSLFLSNKWSLIFRFGLVSNITCIHPHFYGENEPKYNIYNIGFPRAPNCKYSSYSSAIYNPSESILYHFDNDGIYSLDFGASYENIFAMDFDQKEWGWKVWKNKANLKIKFENTASHCMVDNDRFIAVINANNKKSYLFAMNETKLSISIADCCRDGLYRKSMYHNKLHKIITIGNDSFEWYDINKDKSMIFAKHQSYNGDGNCKGYVENIWYSPFNPNIIYCCAKSELYDCDIHERIIQGNLWNIDVREGICREYNCHSIIGNDCAADFVYLKF